MNIRGKKGDAYMNGLLENIEERGLKDPWSAITHFIGMLMAMLAAVPLLIKAAKHRIEYISQLLGYLL